MPLTRHTVFPTSSATRRVAGTLDGARTDRPEAGRRHNVRDRFGDEIFCPRDGPLFASPVLARSKVKSANWLAFGDDD
jgi:hypothetical protein